MRIHHLEIDSFRNLRGFKMDFDSDSNIDVIIGKNGSGKSNLFEAVIAIFKYLTDDEFPLSFNFKIDYTINEALKCVSYHNDILKLNETIVKHFPDDALPENVFIYYSGHNDRITSAIERYEESYRKRIKDDEVKELRRFVWLTNKHMPILLLIMVMLEDDTTATTDLTSQLRVERISSDIKLTLSRPHYFKGKPLESWDQNPFWGVKGYLSDFLSKLSELSSSSDLLREEGYFIDSEEYVLYIPVNRMQELMLSNSPIRIFQMYDDMRVINMLSEIDFRVNLQNGESIRLSEFSDGECQSVFLSGMVELFKNRDCILFLDEPDAFLHPEWQFELIKKLSHHTGSNNLGNQIIVTSHCASTLVSCEDKKINLFEEHNDVLRSLSVSKEYAVRQLSKGMITLDEKKETVNILCKITKSDKPILLTEGHTDCRIIECAWSKLKQDSIPFLVVQGFNRGYLRNLLNEPKIYSEVEPYPVFGLFDFDEAYEDWQQLKGQLIESDPFNGLCKKLQENNGYAFLLPVPAKQALHTQVIKDSSTNETFEEKSKITIEHMFYGYEDTANYFIETSQSGGGSFIEFQGDKHNFADDVVPKLPTEAFVAFTGLFNTLESIIR